MKISCLNRIYFNVPLAENHIIDLTEEHAHYIKTVLRLKIGDQFRIFNGTNGEFIAQIINFTKKNLSVQLIRFLRTPSYIKSLTLAISIIKPDRLILAVNMAVQLGVTKIIPLIAERSQYRNINYERLYKSIIEATEQSERFSPPVLEAAITIKDYLNNNSELFILYANERETVVNNLLKVISKDSYDLIIMIGPEGGFSDTEISMLSSRCHAKSFSLGPNILRAETAVAAALAQVNLLLHANLGSYK